jgi:hypothetical protein
MASGKFYSFQEESIFNKEINQSSGAELPLKFDQKFEVIQEPLSYYSNLLPKHSKEIFVENPEVLASVRFTEVDQDDIEVLPEDDQNLSASMPRSNNTQTKTSVDLRQVLHTKVNGLVQDSCHHHHTLGDSSTPKGNFSFNRKCTGSTYTSHDDDGAPIIDQTVNGRISSPCLQGSCKPIDDPSNLNSLDEPENFTEEETILSGFLHRYVLETKLQSRGPLL